VLVGLTVMLGCMLGLTQVGADTSYWLLGALLFAMGMGMGSTMMPIMSGAMQTLRQAAVARASTTVSILQQVGASIGTAVLTVTLAGALADRLPAAAGGAAAAMCGAASTGGAPPPRRWRGHTASLRRGGAGPCRGAASIPRSRPPRPSSQAAAAESRAHADATE
jgi:hypothetical protein